MKPDKTKRDKTERNQKLCQWLMALTQPSREDSEVIRAYLNGHSLPELLWEYPTLGLSTHLERKLETIAQLISYDGRDVSWRKPGTAGPG